jgi:hypothetical protein
MTETDAPEQPARTFISYSWSSPTHQAWVMRLATRLIEDGVHVVLDKWDLRPGNDAHAFMEQMITDPAVNKVLMICDQTYAEKSNGRAGGVGAEAQILSPELYAKAKQDKYAAIVTEVDDNGKAYTPAFYGGRIYFDFSQAEQEENSYEELLRWLVDKPLYVKPRIGTLPTFLTTPNPVASGTISRLNRALNAARQGDVAVSGLVREYGEALIEALTDLKPNGAEHEHFDDSIIASVEAMRPYVRQLDELVTTVARFDSRGFDEIITIVENLGSMMFHVPGEGTWNSHQYDSYKIICYEVFLRIFAITLSEKRFDLSEELVDHPYLLRNSSGRSGSTQAFNEFCTYAESMQGRNQRLKLNRYDLQADLMASGYKSGRPSFDEMMQADTVLFLRCMMRDANWYPRSLIYAQSKMSPFEIFARSESSKFFKKWAPPILYVDNSASFKIKLSEISSNIKGWFRFGLPLDHLTNVENIGTRE